MVDIEASEATALLALIAWERVDGNILPHDEQRDAELRSVERKLKARPSSVTLRLEAARKSRENAIMDRTQVLAWITRLLPKGSAHLAPVVPARPQSSDWNWVLCIHSDEGAVSWRLSDNEVHNYFGHLKRSACKMGQVTREQKAARLDALLSRH